VKKNILIDTDPGHDDALAIMLLLAHEKDFNILGFVTVAGNQTVDKITKNMLQILEVLKFNYPVVSGAKKPLCRELETGAEAHGSSGLDGPHLPEPKTKALNGNSVEFTYKSIMKAEGKTTIVALGPLTNIANLVTEHPDVKEKIEMISMMGGGLEFGNKTASAEFNIYVDPEAAEIVFSSGIKIVMSGLDVTEKACIMDDQWTPFHNSGPVGKFTADLLEFYTLYSKHYGLIGSSIHDACAVSYILNPELFAGKMFNVHVETKGDITRGMTVADRRSISSAEPNVLVLLDLDNDKFISSILDAIKSLDRRVIELDSNSSLLG
jgi:pyrimidine-specific ribonucleoside hydrolase